MNMEFIRYLLAIMSGLAAAIPLVLKLIEYVQKATKEKNWTSMIRLLMQLMESAEEKYTDGADKKEWVLSMMEKSASVLNYELDLVVVGEMIDALCDMSNVINAPIDDE